MKNRGPFYGVIRWHRERVKLPVWFWALGDGPYVMLGARPLGDINMAKYPRLSPWVFSGEWDVDSLGSLP